MARSKAKTSRGATAKPAPLAHTVPDANRHEEPPCDDHEIAWRYLLPEARMRRWTETIEILDLDHGRREIVIDFSLPEGGEEDSEQRWMVPTAFLGKAPIAPDLEVWDAAGNKVSIPTKPECMAITEAAIAQLHDEEAVDLSTIPELRKLVRQVVFDEVVDARVARLLAEQAMEAGDELLRSLLRALEDQYLLWVPVEGKPGGGHQVTISRRQHFERDEIFPRRRVAAERQVQTALGTMEVELLEARGHRQIKPGVALQRLQLRFGLAPIEYNGEISEAHRFASFHHRVLAPDGLTVRDVGLEASKRGPKGEYLPGTEEVKSEPGLTFQGRESGMSHVHASRSSNPPTLVSMAALGIRDGLTGLWAAATVFAATVLWAIHRLGPSHPSEFSNGQLESTIAILLIGPTLAAAWAIRAEAGPVVERALLGARMLLFSSAAISVVVALAVAGYRPFRLQMDPALEIYASLGYGVAALIVVGWVVTLRPTWFAYRSVLTSARRNLVAVAGTTLLGIAAIAHAGVPGRVAGAALLAAGLVLGAIAAHPGRASSADDRGNGPFLAGLGTIGMLAGAGYFLGFYDNVMPVSWLRSALIPYEAAVLVFSLFEWYRS